MTLERGRNSVVSRSNSDVEHPCEEPPKLQAIGFLTLDNLTRLTAV